MNTDILIAANVPEKDWEYCYITESGTIFPPLYDDDVKEILKTGEQMYNDYLEALKNPPVSEPTEQEQINAMLMREIAILKGQVTAQ